MFVHTPPAQLAFSHDDVIATFPEREEPLDMRLFGVDVSQYLSTHAITREQAVCLLSGGVTNLEAGAAPVRILFGESLEHQMSVLCLAFAWFDQDNLMYNDPFESWPIAQEPAIKESFMSAAFAQQLRILLQNENSCVWIAWYAHVVHFEFAPRRIDTPLRLHLQRGATLKESVCHQLRLMIESRDIYKARRCESATDARLRIPGTSLPTDHFVDMEGPATFYSPHLELVIYEESRASSYDDLTFRIDWPGLANYLAFDSRWANASILQRNRVIISHNCERVAFDCRFLGDGGESDVLVEGPHQLPEQTARALADNEIQVNLGIARSGDQRVIVSVRVGQGIYRLLAPHHETGKLLHLRVRIVHGGYLPAFGAPRASSALGELRARKAAILENGYYRDFRGLRSVLDSPEKLATSLFILERFEPRIDVQHVATLRLVFNFTTATRSVILACRRGACHTDTSYFMHRDIPGVASSAFLYTNTWFQNPGATPIFFNGGGNSYFPDARILSKPAAEVPFEFERYTLDFGRYASKRPDSSITSPKYTVMSDPRMFATAKAMGDAHASVARAKPECLMLQSLQETDPYRGYEFGPPLVPPLHPALTEATVASTDPVFLGVYLTNLSADPRAMINGSELSVTIYDKQQRLHDAGIRMLQVYIHLNYRAHSGAPYEQQPPICVRVGLKSGERGLSGHTFADPGVPLVNPVYFE